MLVSSPHIQYLLSFDVLEADPFEFRNLATEKGYEAILGELKVQLANWRNRTRDPLLSENNLRRLKAEIDASFTNGKPSKDRLNLTYDEYFFDGQG